MRIRLIRHATLIVEYGSQTLLVDPMLDDAGARPAINNSPNPRKNPLVPLPVLPQELTTGLDAVLVTHTHSDHWDTSAARLLPKHLPLFGQPEDEAKFREAGFTRVRPIMGKESCNDVEISRIGGQHGTGDIAKMMAPVSGFVLRGGNEPTLYIAGDTVWCAELEAALKKFQPDVIVLNAGGARFLQGGPITMTADDVITVCRNATDAQVVAVHMEAINHCLVNRADLAFQLEAARVRKQVCIPQDGEWVDLRAQAHHQVNG
ncbi:MAG: MBL fold metallo-hydrolase [Acidobacteriia bacterium]|nr:MBL fold metallo-hydrolase [Terriglobia bacterium]